MKDYYRTLGVLDDAEDIIIRAAYKALAQRYHPDKWKGDPQEANKRMSDINEAYDVLSDSVKRKKYDEEFFKSHPKNEATDSSEYAEEFDSDEIEAWSIACDFHPNLQINYQQLKRYDSILANTFRTTLLESKDFKNSDSIRFNFERQYLIRFFGNDPDVIHFAKKLYSINEVKVALRLNKIVRAVGDTVRFEDIKNKLLAEFPHLKMTDYKAIQEDLIYKLKNNFFTDLVTPDFEFLYKSCHYSNTLTTYVSDSKTRYRFNVDGITYDCDHAQMCLYLKQRLGLN